ncbi:MAG: hypothetical protein R3B74_16675 [Nitrospirales bacterium]|nr:hypothetical protein [Nitrospirales bacterium]
MKAPISRVLPTPVANAKQHRWKLTLKVGDLRVFVLNSHQTRPLHPPPLWAAQFR